MVFLLIHRLRSRLLSFSLSLSPLSSFYVCRHIQRAIHKLKFIVFFKMNVCFCKKQLAMQVPAKRNAGCSTGFECLISHWLTRRGGRTYVRSDISDVITLPKFFACMHLLYSLTHGASLRARSSAKIQNLSKKASSIRSRKEGVSGFPVQIYKRNIYCLK